MSSKIQTLLQRIATSVKTFVRTMGRMMAPAPHQLPASCTNISMLLLHLCDFDPLAHQYIIKWLAYPLQNPGAKMQYAIVVNGPQGTGASLFFDRVVSAIYGDQARQLNARQLVEWHFNDWADNARFVVVEATRTPKLAAKIKSLITSGSIIIERKGVEPYEALNQMNFVLVSNSDDLLPLSAADRRYMVLEAPPAREPLFYKAVGEEIRNGGVDAFRDYLLYAVDLTDFNQFDEPPKAARLAKLEAA